MVVATDGRLTLVTAPANEPVDETEAKAHLRVDGSDEDTLIAALIEAARQRVEALTGRSLVTQTWELKADRFPPNGTPIVLAKPPLQSVTSVKYIDTDGVEQTWASGNYTVDAPAGPQAPRGRIIPNYDVEYPTTRLQPNAVTVRFVAGYGDQGTDVPEALRRSVLMLLGHLYENRESVSDGSFGGVSREVPQSLGFLLAPYRTTWGIA